MENTWVGANYQGLKCYKDLLSAMYKTFGKVSHEEARDKVLKSACPTKDWQFYREGMTPRRSSQREQQNRSFRWTKAGVIITIIGVAVTLTVLALRFTTYFINSTESPTIIMLSILLALSWGVLYMLCNIASIEA